MTLRIILLVVGLFLLHRGLRTALHNRSSRRRHLQIGLRGESMVRQLLQKTHGLSSLHDIMVYTKNGGTMQLDHLVRLPHGLLLIETKNWGGEIAVSDYGVRVESRGRVRKLGNPVEQVAKSAERLAERFGVPVHPLVVLTSGRVTGVSKTVLTLDQLPERLHRLTMARGQADGLERVWRVLCSSRRNRILQHYLRTRHLAWVTRKSRGKWRFTAAAGAACLSFGLLASAPGLDALLSVAEAQVSYGVDVGLAVMTHGQIPSNPGLYLAPPSIVTQPD